MKQNKNQNFSGSERQLRQRERYLFSTEVCMYLIHSPSEDEELKYGNVFNKVRYNSCVESSRSMQ